MGAAKTGSSALQHAFSTASRTLAQYGIHYPERPGARRRSLEGLPVGGNAAGIRRGFDAGDIAQAIANLHALTASERDVLLSEEGLYLASQDNLILLRNSVPDMDARVLVFFRLPADRFVAGYLQALKAGKAVSDSVDDHALRLHRAGLHNPWHCAQRLEKAFGQVKVCWYPAVMRGAGVVAKAFNWLGVPPPIANEVINPSPGREAVLVLQNATKAGLVRRAFSDRFLSKAVGECGLGSKMALGEHVRRLIDAETREDNTALLRRYCPDLSPELELATPPAPAAESIDEALVECLNAIAAKVALELGDDPDKVKAAFGG